MCRCSQSFLECIGTNEWGRAVVFVFLQNVLGDVYPGMFRIEFLNTTLAREDVCKVVNSQRLFCRGMDRRKRLVGHISLDVVPLLWYFTFLQNEFLLSFHIFVNVIIFFSRCAKIIIILNS